MNKNLLKSEIVKAGYNLGTFSESIDISRTGFNRRINGKIEFSLSEIQSIKEKLNMSDDTFMSIFFNKKVS